MKVRFSYLKEKFNPIMAEHIWDRVKDTVTSGDFTLGKEVQEFERRFAEMMGVKYAVGVANGTDALELSLYLCGVRAGDEVIAPANTFVASLGAIGNLQAKPVLVDMGPHYVMDPAKIEAAITPKTKAILPVHFCGNPVDMDEVMRISVKHNIPVVEDACQAFLASYKGACVGSIGLFGAFSLHPLKILNVWGDGGVITTNDETMYKELKLLQNHGMQSRDNITRFPCRNSRLDSIHAAVANYQLEDTPKNVKQRRLNAQYYSDRFSDIRGVTLAPPREDIYSCHHLYFIEVDQSLRGGLYNSLNASGIEAKIHYEIPLYQQPGLACLGYLPGNFPVADRQAKRYITLPVDELVTIEQMEYVVRKVEEFMALNGRVW